MFEKGEIKMINKITFKNYKLFKQEQILEIKPITILIGKNSSGKSAVLKLLMLIEGALSHEFKEPLQLHNQGVELGSEFRDLIYARRYGGRLELTMESNVTEVLNVIVGHNPQYNPEIFAYSLNNVEIDPLKEHFNGFIPDSYTLNSLTLSTNYISSHRKGLQRYFDQNNKVYDVVGLNGENVYSILIQDALTTPKILLNKVSQFYKDNFEGWGFRINQDNPPYQIELKKETLKINFKEVGLGMVHALPLVVQAFMPTQKDLLTIIEEPELHLHPAAHGNLAQLFAESLADNNKRYMIETHSQNFVLRLRRLVAEGALDKDNVVIYYVDYNEEKSESSLTRINIDKLGKPRNENGEIYWPEHIFSETLDETSAIRTAQLNQKKYDC